VITQHEMQRLPEPEVGLNGSYLQKDEPRSDGSEKRQVRTAVTN
jgi:hypothetical protein